MDFYVIVWLEVFNKWNIYDKKKFWSRNFQKLNLKK